VEQDGCKKRREQEESDQRGQHRKVGTSLRPVARALKRKLREGDRASAMFATISSPT
jgi:hypothetical protein